MFSYRRKFIYGPGIDEPIMMIVANGQTETEYYYHFDGLGSVIALSDANNDIVERYSYDVFGEATIRDANNSVVSASSVANPYLFTGRRYDDETDLYYYRARYYHPEIGRFMQTDPLGYKVDINLYRYVGNNTTMLKDPYGLDSMVMINNLKWREYLKPKPGSKCCKKKKKQWEMLFSSEAECIADITGIFGGGAGAAGGAIGGVVTIGQQFGKIGPGGAVVGVPIAVIGVGSSINYAIAHAACNQKHCVEWGIRDECGECK